MNISDSHPKHSDLLTLCVSQNLILSPFNWLVYKDILALKLSGQTLIWGTWDPLETGSI